MANICLIEDEKDLNQILKIYIEKEGHTVKPYYNMKSIFEKIGKNKEFDLYIIDIMLPDGSGIEILKKIKNVENVPVILISARGDSIDRVLGFELGCDDYVAKPFLPMELVYRVSKLIKSKVDNTIKDINILQFDGYTLDKSKRIVFLNQSKVDLTSREYDIVLYFLENKQIAISRDQLIENVWGGEYFGYDRIVDNYIKNIRKKLPLFNLETIYGYGYRCNL